MRDSMNVSTATCGWCEETWPCMGSCSGILYRTLKTKLKFTVCALFIFSSVVVAMYARLLIPSCNIIIVQIIRVEILNRLAYHYNNFVVESLFCLIICQNLALTKITTTCPVVNCGPPQDILVDLFIFKQGYFLPTLPLRQVKPQQCCFSLMFKPVV